ncbi:excalibur calcium-binding domain-containing protein [Thorsellia kenyensis]|uniref:Excalibur calcium-binding domain-containing protein n=1 Tax=Thorsellia kenyensis TaxID=1549888 RepID=A0ABV6C718_9GAMM
MKNFLMIIIFTTACLSASAETKTDKQDIQKIEKYDCTKKTCPQMVSCEEAMYKLKQCGMGKLDRDKDGVPCETICSGG